MFLTPPAHFASVGRVGEDLEACARRTPRRRIRGSRSRRPRSARRSRPPRRRWSAGPSTAPRTRSGRTLRGSTSGCTTSACTWKALTSTAPTLFRFENMWMSGSSWQYSCVWFQNSQPSGSSWAIDPTRASCTPGCSLLDLAVGVDHAVAGPSTGRTATPAASAAGRGRCRTDRRCRRRLPAPAPCSWARADRSPAATTTGLRRCASAGMYSCMWKIGGVVVPDDGARKPSTSGLGDDRSIWQRHTHLRPASSGPCRGSWPAGGRARRSCPTRRRLPARRRSVGCSARIPRADRR